MKTRGWGGGWRPKWKSAEEAKPKTGKGANGISEPAVPGAPKQREKKP